MTDLIDTTEMYLRTILELEEENIVALRARIAERLRHSGPTVSQTIGRMERDGLVVVSGTRQLELTDLGRRSLENLREAVERIRLLMTEEVSEEEYAALLAVLQRMATNLGWDGDVASGPTVDT